MPARLDPWVVARLFGCDLAPLGRRSHCPIRPHKRQDKSFKLFVATSGKILYKCFSCSPPFDVGDAVALYAAMSGVDRKTAWRDLKDRGYDVPGGDGISRRSSAKPPVRKVVPVDGPRHQEILRCDLAQWARWREQRLAAVEQFCSGRGLDAAGCRRLDVMDVDAGSVGFGYRDPTTGLPCRVKVRSIAEKRFRIEPCAAPNRLARALAPFYLAHSVKARRGALGAVVITEGEVDALTLRQAGIANAVSLPDGAGSADRVDLVPLIDVASVWLLATDADEEGDKAARTLFRRAGQIGVVTARVFWRKEGVVHKDANDALAAGFGVEDFRACLDATSRIVGQRVA